MCRHLGYLGPARSVASVLLGGEHSLVTQSWAPRDMRGGGTVNADGYGVGWWSGGLVGRHRSVLPIWADSALGEHGVLDHISSSGMIAAVRSATVGMATAEGACAPFTDGHWAFSHNGVVRGWPTTMAQLGREIDPVDALTLEAPTDSALLWALLRGRLRTTGRPAEAVRGLILDVEAAAPGSRLNLLLGDGSRFIASTWDHSLWWRRQGGELWLASEPIDKREGWTEVPDRHLVVADADGVNVEPIGDL